MPKKVILLMLQDLLWYSAVHFRAEDARFVVIDHQQPVSFLHVSIGER